MARRREFLLEIRYSSPPMGDLEYSDSVIQTHTSSWDPYTLSKPKKKSVSRKTRIFCTRVYFVSTVGARATVTQIRFLMDLR